MLRGSSGGTSGATPAARLPIRPQEIIVTLSVKCIALVVACSLAVACSDLGLGPTAPQKTTLAFCVRPAWAAVTTDATKWTFLPLTGDSVSLDATGKIGFAYSADPIDYTIVWGTVDELRAAFVPTRCTSFLGSLRSAGVTTTGVPSDMSARVFSAVGSTGFLGDSTSQLYVPDLKSADLIGSRFLTVSGYGQDHPDRIILRHNVPVGASVGVFDFGSSEAVSLDSAALTLTPAGTPALSSFVTDSGRFVFQYLRPASATYLYSLPGRIMDSTDYHMLTAPGLTYYYRAAAPTTLTAGPTGLKGSVSVISTSPCYRLHVEIPVVSPYLSYATATFFWGQSGVSRFTMTMTSGFAGGASGAWSFDVPDFKQPDGSCLMQFNPANGMPGSTAQVSDGPWPLSMGAPPTRMPELVRYTGVQLSAATP